MRPVAITRFGYFQLASLAVIFANNIIHWDYNAAVFANDSRFADYASIAFYLSISAPVVIPLLLWFFVLRRGSNIARWVVVGYSGLWLLGVVNAIGTMPVLMISLTATGLLFQLIAIYWVFRPEANAWLSGR